MYKFVKKKNEYMRMFVKNENGYIRVFFKKEKECNSFLKREQMHEWFFLKKGEWLVDDVS